MDSVSDESDSGSSILLELQKRERYKIWAMTHLGNGPIARRHRQNHATNKTGDEKVISYEPNGGCNQWNRTFLCLDLHIAEINVSWGIENNN